MAAQPDGARLRRGGTLSGLLATLSIVGALSVTTVVIAPKYLMGRVVPPPSVVTARAPAHQELTNALAALIGRSAGVLAIHPRGATPYVELLLWLQDDEDPGELDEGELALISHSRVLRTVTVYRLAAGEDPSALPLSAARLAGSDFCDRWRADPRVEPVVLATGVSDLEVERLQPLRPLEAGDGHPLRIGLTWASDSADGPDEASALVDALMRQWGPQE